jgi:hypothetical protein
MINFSKIFLLSLLIISVFSMNSFSQNQTELSYFFPDNLTFDPNIPTPEEFFGFQLGEWHLRHDQLVQYLYELARVSPRIQIEKYGTTYEQRPLLLLTISSPENLSHIEEIKSQHKKIINPEESGKLPLEQMPVIVWMGYSVHGNEASGSNAVPLVTYYLAALQGNDIETLIRDMIILIDPCINPDGFSRFAAWANMHRAKNPIADPYNREHQEAWPGGRTNHYWFDLNRDWLLIQHPETKGRLKKFYEWMPNILTDHHETGTNHTFFFQPGILSRTNPLIPSRNIELTSEIATFHSEALDKIGSLYFTKQIYDDFYFGKGSTYPDLNGGIGILFEQASSRGLIQESINGLLTFPFAIRNQLTTSLSTLKGGQALRIELLEHQKNFYNSVNQEVQQEKIKAFVFGDQYDPIRIYHFLEILLGHQIEVYHLKKIYQKGITVFSPENSYIVPLNQPQLRLIKALFETPTEFNDSLFYDISSWTLPLAFNLSFSELSESMGSYLGEKLKMNSFPRGKFIQVPKPIAYAFSWDNYYSPRALYRILKKGISAKVTTEEFTSTVNGKKYFFSKGSVVIPLNIQKNEGLTIDSILEEIANKNGLEVIPLSSGLSDQGPDLGSPSLELLDLPTTLLMTGEGLSSSEAGEIWHLLDHKMEMELSLIEKSNINRVDLTKYNSIVLVNGNVNELDSAGVAELRRWVLKGGTLIARGTTGRWLARNNFMQMEIKDRDESPKDLTKSRPYALRSADMGKERISGAIVECTIDLTHPLGYGYKKFTLPIFKNNTLYLKAAGNLYSTPLQYTSNPLLSGYISPKNMAQLKNSAAVIVSQLGRGRVIIFSDNPNFRAFWYGTNKLFLNALFFGKLIN